MANGGQLNQVVAAMQRQPGGFGQQQGGFMPSQFPSMPGGMPSAFQGAPQFPYAMGGLTPPIGPQQPVPLASMASPQMAPQMPGGPSPFFGQGIGSPSAPAPAPAPVPAAAPVNPLANAPEGSGDRG